MGQPFRRGLDEVVKQRESVSRPLVALASLSTQVRRSQSPEEQAESTETSIYYMPFMSVDSLIDSYEWYNDVIRDVAAKTDVLLIGDEHRIPGDSVHFTYKGSAVMAARVTAALSTSPRLRELAK